ncbi:TMEM175 family protein [Pedobacter sp. Du54]|uniref:TMEM175 family protein n=1 Tax=Pedobacter anseongensis TaxID=3133439 RepID=UPI0030998DF0
MKKENEEITKEEIKKEFQLERMILFSDAVFAIVITLMAIEIHLPELPEHQRYTDVAFLNALKHLLPMFFGYALSFFFIGQMWYKHLQIFSILKDYDKGLVIRNLVFLFFIGLFPFGASIVMSGNGTLLPPLTYFIIIILCMASQLLLHDYILNRSKGIIIKVDNTEQKVSLRKRILSLAAMVAIAILAYITYLIIPNAQDKEYAIFWIFVFMLAAYRINKKRKEIKAKK